MASMQILAWPSRQQNASDAVHQWTVNMKGVVAGNCICLYHNNQLLESWPITAEDLSRNEKKLTAPSDKVSSQELSQCQFWLYASTARWAPQLHLKGFPVFPPDCFAPSPSSATPPPSSRTCALGHPCSLHTYMHGKHLCNICRKNISAGSAGVRCDACDFDVCSECSAKSSAIFADDGARIASEATALAETAVFKGIVHVLKDPMHIGQHINEVGAAVQLRRQGVAVGEKSLIVFGKNEQREAMEERALEAYRHILSKATVLDSSHAQVVRVRAIMHKLLPAASKFNPRANEWNWEANVIDSKDINAFCCPGGRIAFYTGILESMQMSDDEVAAVMGHEMAHALREHSLEKMCKHDAVHGLATLGGHVLQEHGANATLVHVAEGTAEFLLSTKFSRVDERDADLVGMELAARAGFHPRGAVTIHEKILAKQGTSILNWLSTHPSGDQRVADLEANLPAVLPLYEHAVAVKTTSEEGADAVVHEVAQQVDRTVEALEDAIAHGAGSAGALMQNLWLGARRK